ncbi:MAG: hypothetical protein ABIH00_01440 [Armatimonadota bacterium]
MKEINSKKEQADIYAQQNKYVEDVKDTYLQRLADEQNKLMNTLRGKEAMRFDSMYNEIVERIDSEEL